MAEDGEHTSVGYVQISEMFEMWDALFFRRASLDRV